MGYQTKYHQHWRHTGKQKKQSVSPAAVSWTTWVEKLKPSDRLVVHVSIIIDMCLTCPRWAHFLPLLFFFFTLDQCLCVRELVLCMCVCVFSCESEQRHNLLPPPSSFLPSFLPSPPSPLLTFPSLSPLRPLFLFSFWISHHVLIPSSLPSSLQLPLLRLLTPLPHSSSLQAWLLYVWGHYQWHPSWCWWVSK